MVIDRNFTVEMKKKVIIDFLKDNRNPGFSQGELARQLMTDLGYVSIMSAKVSINKMLMDLEQEGTVRFVEKKAERGSIPMKIWFLQEAVHQTPVQAMV